MLELLESTPVIAQDGPLRLIRTKTLQRLDDDKVVHDGVHFV